MIPCASVLGVGNVLRMQRGAFDRQVLVHGLSRNAAHHVHAEFETEPVHRVGERAESFAVCRTRETLLVGNLPAICIDAQRRAVGIAVRVGVGVEPAGVDDQRVPAGVLEMLGHEARVVQNLLLGDGGAVGVPAVPAHRRTPGFDWHGLGYRVAVSRIFVSRGDGNGGWDRHRTSLFVRDRYGGCVAESRTPSCEPYMYRYIY